MMLPSQTGRPSLSGGTVSPHMDCTIESDCTVLIAKDFMFSSATRLPAKLESPLLQGNIHHFSTTSIPNGQCLPRLIHSVRGWGSHVANNDIGECIGVVKASETRRCNGRFGERGWQTKVGLFHVAVLRLDVNLKSAMNS